MPSRGDKSGRSVASSLMMMPGACRVVGSGSMR